MKDVLPAMIWLLFVCGSVVGDSWSYAPKRTEEVFEFGKSNLVLECDATKNQTYPPHTLSS